MVQARPARQPEIAAGARSCAARGAAAFLVSTADSAPADMLRQAQMAAKCDLPSIIVELGEPGVPGTLEGAVGPALTRRGATPRRSPVTPRSTTARAPAEPLIHGARPLADG